MSTYLEEDRILFSCDCFGSHIAKTGLFVDGVECIMDEAKRYYAEIMMPFRTIVQKNLDKIKDQEIRLIAPSHGPIHRVPQSIIEAYSDWSDDQPKNTVVVPWVTMHGSTGTWSTGSSPPWSSAASASSLQHGLDRHRPAGHGSR